MKAVRTPHLSVVRCLSALMSFGVLLMFIFPMDALADDTDADAGDTISSQATIEHKVGGFNQPVVLPDNVGGPAEWHKPRHLPSGP